MIDIDISFILNDNRDIIEINSITILWGGKGMINKQQASIAPDFKVNDSEGRAIQLADYRSKKHVLLVFNRGFT
jgi:hypothetical protein